MPIRYTRIFSYWGNKQQEQGTTMLTPVKAIKGEEPVITQREKAGRELFSTAVSKVRQPIEAFFNWLNEKTNIQRAMKVRSTSGLFSTYDGKNCHRIHLSNFLKQESEINY